MITNRFQILMGVILMNNKSDKYVMASVEAIVNEIESGDTIWAGNTTSISVAFLDALAKRQNELKNVTILVAKGNTPCKILDELKYKDSFRVVSFFTEALVQTFKKGNASGLLMSSAETTIEAICNQFGVNTIAVSVCPPDDKKNCNVGKSGNYITTTINKYSGITKRFAIVDQNLSSAVGNESETTLPLSIFDLVA